MIRAALFGWVLPMAFLGGWWGLASNDISLGTTMFSRAFFDQIFAMYGNLLGVDPALLPGLVGHAVLVDSLVVAGIVALRHQRRIRGFLAERWRALAAHSASAAESRKADSLSSAP